MEREEGIVRFTTTGAHHWRSCHHWKLFINQAWRDARLLAHTNASFLFEYVMPNGKWHMHEVTLNSACEFSSFGNTVSARRIPMKWKLAEWFHESIMLSDLELPQILEAA